MDERTQSGFPCTAPEETRLVRQDRDVPAPLCTETPTSGSAILAFGSGRPVVMPDVVLSDTGEG